MTLRLKVTSIERYHLCDDTAANPNVIGCELTVSGDVNMDIATTAARSVAKRHAMFCARLKGNFWNVDTADAELVSWQVVDAESSDEANKSGEDLRVIDPRKGFPAKLILRRDGDLTHLSFCTHHAAVDGVGGLQGVIDWLMSYERISNGSGKPNSRETSLELLKRRNHLQLLNREFIGKLWIQPIAILGATKFLFRRVQPVTDGLTNQQADLPRDFQMISHKLTKEHVATLKQQAAQHKATVNELVLRAVFLGIHEFRKRQGFHKPNEWLRLIIPISIRDFADRRLPASNRATIVQLDRTDRDFADPDGLVWTLNHELGNIKRWNLEKTFLLFMKCVSWIPGFVARGAKKNVCRATSVVTNLGAPLERVRLERIDGKIRSGNLIVEDVSLISPLRRQTSIGFAVLRYNRQLKLCLHFDPLQISRAHAEEILDLTGNYLGPVVAENNA